MSSQRTTSLGTHSVMSILLNSKNMGFLICIFYCFFPPLSVLYYITANDVNTIIKATWPNPDEEPRLFDIVKRSMIHGPCRQANPNAPYMKDGKCTKGFPKPFQAETVMCRDSYPIYARPNNGHAYKVGNYLADNRWIVPYNPYLLSWYNHCPLLYCKITNQTTKRYNAHINVECIMLLSATKYITKYTHKGPDRVTLELRQHNEVSKFKDGCYIAAAEATWRLFENPIHHQEPAVISLQVHLPRQHMVVFKPDESIKRVRARASEEKSMLTAFFELNRIDPDARQFTYQKLPLHYIWERSKKKSGCVINEVRPLVDFTLSLQLPKIIFTFVLCLSLSKVQQVGTTSLPMMASYIPPFTPHV